jgi:uncharacterized protein involved in exopolysaccharide biosynthesis
MQESVPRNAPTLIDHVMIIWNRRRLLSLLIIVPAVCALVVSLALPKQYRSETVILIIAPESGGLGAMLSASPLAGALGATLTGSVSPVDKALIYLKSRTIAERVIRRFDLLRVFNERKWDARKGAWKDPARPPLMEDAVDRLVRKVATFKKSREGTISVSVLWKDPKLAADIANYYVSSLIEFMKDKSVNMTVQIIDPAVPAEKKASPGILRNTALAGIVGLLAGIVLAFVLENLSRQKRK